MKFQELVLSPSTKKMLLAMTKQPPHALLITGATGMGKRTLAESWAREALGSDKVDVRFIEPDEKGTISIDQIRELYSATRSKHIGKRAIIIDHAETMGHEAQNALLKLLEEPLPGNILILTSPSSETMLATIVSRTQIVSLRPISQAAALSLLDKYQGLDKTRQAQILFIAHNRPAELHKLASDKEYLQEQVELTSLAKKILSAPLFERLSAINELSKDRQATLQLVERMEQMVKINLKTASSPGGVVQLADSLQRAYDRIVQNGNVRAQLLALLSSY